MRDKIQFWGLRAVVSVPNCRTCLEILESVTKSGGHSGAVVEQEKNQQQPKLAAPAAAGEIETPAVAPPPARPWPVVFTLM
jgi:hypothetical protein